jgi:hypothetical protein
VKPKTKNKARRPKRKAQKFFERDHGAVVIAAPLGGIGAPHRPVLLEETLKFLAPERGGLFVDCTVGYGGHSEAILKSSQNTRVLGIDLDPAALAYTTSAWHLSATDSAYFKPTFALSTPSCNRRMSASQTAFLSTLASLHCSLIHPSVGLVFVSMLL